MASIERIILVCDNCGCDEHDGNGPVDTHNLSVDGNAWQLEACGHCWTTVYHDALAPLAKHAARVRIPVKRQRTRAGLRSVS